MCSGYINSFKAMRLNFREEAHKEVRLKTLQQQEDKILAVWAKRQLRIEQQIAVKQSPLQRARRIRNRRQEEINRINSNITNGATDKSCEKRLSKMVNIHQSGRNVKERLMKLSQGLPEDVSSSSSVSLPTVPVDKQKHVRRNSLPILHKIPPAKNDKRLSLPSISSNQLADTTTGHRTGQPFPYHKLPPLKK